MHDHHPTILSSADHARLQGLMCTMIGRRTPLASLLRRKLGSAVIMPPPDAAPDDLVTSGRSVRFSINESDHDERKLAWHASKRADPSLLSLQEPRGLALLGLRVGQSIAYGIESDQTEFLTVQLVLTDEDTAFLPIPQEAAATLVQG